MCWKITKDHISEESPLNGFSPYHPGEIRKGEAVPFRLYDDDGELYFEGLIAKSWIEGPGEFAFDPLDWAMPQYGCTEMRHKKNGKWETL
jgi:hypothetical protein